MAYPTKKMRNRVTGQDITFVHTAEETHGQLLEMIANYRPNSTEPPAHYHPQQAEDFEVVFGKLTVRMAGTLQTLQAGDKLHIPVGQVHSMWNDSAEPTLVNWQIRPALDTEFLLETITGLANDGKVDGKGTPTLLQTALTAPKFSDSIRFASPPYVVQRILFTLLRPFAYLMGYRATYKKYF